MVQHALKAAQILEKEGIEAEVVNMRFVKPIDADLIGELANRFEYLLTVEDNSRVGGFGSAVSEVLAAKGHKHITLRIHGIPDRFVDHGTPDELYRDVKLDAQGIADVASEFLHSQHAVLARTVGAIAN